MSHSRRLLGAVCVVGQFLLAEALGPACLAQEPAERPRLVVLVVFDQMRGDYLTRWESLFGNEGFRRLGREGGVVPELPLLLCQHRDGGRPRIAPDGLPARGSRHYRQRVVRPLGGQGGLLRRHQSLPAGPTCCCR